METILLVGHDNYGSREIFSEIVEQNPDQKFVLFITTGLYYRKSFFASIVKLLKQTLGNEEEWPNLLEGGKKDPRQSPLVRTNIFDIE